MTKKQTGVMFPGDLALARRCQAGEEAAWRELLARYRGLCFYLAERYGCRPFFDDLFSDLTSWLAEDGIGGYDGMQELAKFLSRRFCNQICSFLRQARRENKIRYYEGLDFLPAACEVAEKDELYHALRRSEESLPAEEQDILEDYYVRGEKLESLARSREIVPSTAMRRLRKAMEHLRSAMEENWREEME